MFRDLAVLILAIAALAAADLRSWILPLLALAALRRLWARPACPAEKTTLEKCDQPVESDGYEDPLRWCFLPSNGLKLANARHAEEFENELIRIKCVAMHRPTHETWRESTGDYPYSFHLKGRKRLWEIRLQMRFKKVPTSKLHFGIELEEKMPASAATRRMKEVLLKLVQGVVGDFYYAEGEGPEDVGPGEEMEPPTFVLPMWAFDQFEVSEPGQEPDITGDLEGIGMKRTDGLKAYIQSLKATVENFSEDKVYTFCIWGISQFLDCMRWEVRGLFPGMGFNFSRFGLQPPLKISIYEIPEEHDDPRHLVSRKLYYVSMAMWSTGQPPPPAKLQALLGEDSAVATATAKPQLFEWCTGRGAQPELFGDPLSWCTMPHRAMGA